MKSSVCWNHVTLPLRTTAALSVFIALAGCGVSGPGTKSSQVVATVNGHEITVTQLNQSLALSGVDEVTPGVARQAVDSLIAEELLVQDALKNKLDRQPAVVQAIERARRQVLAQSFAEKNLYARTPPTALEIAEYYKNNPVLFANRKIYRLTALSVPKSAITAAIRSELDKVHGADQVRELLDKHGLAYETQFISVAPEQLPIDRLPLFAKAAVGDPLLMEQNDGKELLMTVTEVQEAPVSAERARPMIRQYLISVRHKEAMEAYLQGSKATAKIAYLRDLQDPTLRNESRLPQGPEPQSSARIANSDAARVN